MLPFLPDGGISTQFWDRTVGFQLGRDSPFSIWGQHACLALAPDRRRRRGGRRSRSLVAFVPRRKTPLQLAALGAAVLIALQLALSHWFYLYIVWWFPLG